MISQWFRHVIYSVRVDDHLPKSSADKERDEICEYERVDDALGEHGPPADGPLGLLVLVDGRQPLGALGPRQAAPLGPGGGGRLAAQQARRGGPPLLGWDVRLRRPVPDEIRGGDGAAVLVVAGGGGGEVVDGLDVAAAVDVDVAQLLLERGQLRVRAVGRRFGAAKKSMHLIQHQRKGYPKFQ